MAAIQISVGFATLANSFLATKNNKTHWGDAEDSTLKMLKSRGGTWPKIASPVYKEPELEDGRLECRGRCQAAEACCVIRRSTILVQNCEGFGQWPQFESVSDSLYWPTRSSQHDSLEQSRRHPFATAQDHRRNLAEDCI